MRAGDCAPVCAVGSEPSRITFGTSSLSPCARTRLRSPRSGSDHPRAARRYSSERSEVRGILPFKKDLGSNLSRRPMSAKNLSIRQARGITLVNDGDIAQATARANDSTCLRGSQLHYTADWIAYFAHKPESMPPTAEKWFKNGLLKVAILGWPRSLGHDR